MARLYCQLNPSLENLGFTTEKTVKGIQGSKKLSDLGTFSDLTELNFLV